MKIIKYTLHGRLVRKIKLLLIAIPLLLGAAGAGAQVAPVESLKELILRLRESKPDTNRISLELKLGSYYLYKPGEYKDDLDSTIRYFNEALQLSNQLHETDWQYRTLALIGNYYVEAGDLERCKAYFMRVIAYEHQKADLVKEADTWFWLADILHTFHKIDQKQRLSYYQRAYSMYLQTHQPLKAANALKGIADLHLQAKQYNLAESELYSIIRAPNNAGRHIILAANELLTELYIKKGEYNKALPSALKTVGIMQATSDSASAFTYYMWLTAIYHTLGKPSLCLVWAKKGFNHAAAVKAYNDLYYFTAWIAIELIAEDKAKEALRFTITETARYKPKALVDKMVVDQTLGRCYEALRKIDLAEKYYLEMIQLDREAKDGLAIGLRVGNYYVIGNFYLNIKKYKEAEKYLTEALITGKQYGVLHSLQNTYLSLFKTDSALGNYTAAISHLLLYNRLKDSIFTVAKNQQVEELQIKYNIAENEKNLSLAQNKTRLEQIALQRTQNTRNWTIAGSGLLLIIAGLLYRQNRLGQKNSRIINHKNELLEKLVGEKELLLKEVHHRVKNNLYIVMSLLESQSSFLKDDAALTAILESQNRVRAIALIHQKLYGSQNVVQVDMQAYIPELINSLAESFGTSRRKIVILHDIDSITLDVSQAIPIAIILNEAVTNAIKYAFGEQGGQIKIYMRQQNADKILLSISDNGVGIPFEIDLENHKSLGLTLIRGLVSQLQGELTIRNIGGVTIDINFPKEESPHFNQYELADVEIKQDNLDPL